MEEKFITVADAARADAAREERLRQIVERGSQPLPIQLARESCVPLKYQNARLREVDGMPPDVAARYLAASRHVEMLANETGRIIAMVGPRGTGKTSIACAVVNDFCSRGRLALYCDTMDFFLRLKATYGDGAAQDQLQVERQLLLPELLVLDEVHERGETDWEDRMLTRLVNKRYGMERPTILISNQKIDEFQRRVGTSIVDRIADGGGIVPCDWASLRRRA